VYTLFSIVPPKVELVVSNWGGASETVTVSLTLPVFRATFRPRVFIASIVTFSCLNVANPLAVTVTS